MTIRVASTQYRTGNDVQANLQTLLSLLDEAAAGSAQLVVAPEFGNHTSFYESPQQAWEVAVDEPGEIFISNFLVVLPELFPFALDGIENNLDQVLDQSAIAEQ